MNRSRVAASGWRRCGRYNSTRMHDYDHLLIAGEHNQRRLSDSSRYCICRLLYDQTSQQVEKRNDYIMRWSDPFTLDVSESGHPQD
jgi:hypothetical protein